MKTEFFKPRFDGGRFAEHTLPVELGRDLAAYETLVIELAKWLYLKEHPRRKRVPKGFEDRFHLHIEKLDEGSTIPILTAITGVALTFGGISNVDSYFIRARDLIAARVESNAADSNVQEFPPELLIHFNQIGKSLRDDESWSFNDKSVLTPQRRRELVLASSNYYEKEIEIFGVITEVNFEDSSFKLKTLDDRQVKVPMDLSTQDKIREFGGRYRHGLLIKADAVTDSFSRVKQINSAKSIEIYENYQITSRLESISQLEDGWLDGSGNKLNQDSLQILMEKCAIFFPEDIAIPAIVPTPSGNILFEWGAPNYASIDFDLANLSAYCHAFSQEKNDVETEIKLSSEDDWSNLFIWIRSQFETRETYGS